MMISVKEVVSSIISIPQNFIRLDHEEPSFSSSSSFDSDFPGNITPTIDMNQLISGGKDNNSELHNLHSACNQWGLFQLINHGVCPSLLKELKHEIEEFFELPLEEKMKFGVRAGEYEGYGTLVQSGNQKLDWVDRFFIVTNPIHRRKPHLLPQLTSSLRNTLELYSKEMRKIAMKLFKMLETALRIEVGKMNQVFEDGMEAMRMSYYPPCPHPNLVMGLRAHSDASGLTILNQLNGVHGLQIKRDGMWYDVRFLPDAFVVNVGDVLEVLSNGKYKSIEHRAAVNSEKGRLSIATFYNPKFEAVFGPEISSLNPQEQPLFKRILMEDYVKQFFATSFKGKLNLERMKIQTDEGNAPT